MFDIKTIVSSWRENVLGYLSADIICSEKRTVFRERSPRETVSFEEQIMSKDNYPSIFSPQMETIVFIILQIFYATRGVLKIGGYLTIIPLALNGYEMIDSSVAPSWLSIISYPPSATGIIVLLKTPPKYRKLDYNKNKKAQKITHTLAIFVDHGIITG